MDYYGFPVFKGLQRPLEFMGIRGRFITIAAVCIGISFLSFLLFSAILGELAGFIALAIVALTSLIVIYVKQKSGLHNKKRFKGIIIYKSVFKTT